MLIELNKGVWVSCDEYLLDEGTLDDKYWEMIDTMRLSQLRELDD